MRFLDPETLRFREVAATELDRSRLSYCIISHQWLHADNEILFDDVRFIQDVQSKPGYQKFSHACELANQADFELMWMDTCCIDRKDAWEVEEAVTGMYKWYSMAQVCIVYLQDVCHLGQLHTSQWFKRSWTLPELIAPRSLRFYDRNWRFLGTKQTLLRELVNITGIPPAVLTNVDVPHQYSVAQRMSWAARRRTKREEDRAYCLMGLFDVQIPINYGEGEQEAFFRLQRQILSTSSDDSIFAWDLRLAEVDSEQAEGQYCGLLATSPDCFLRAGDIEERGPLQDSRTFQDSLSLCLPAQLHTLGTYQAYLNVWESGLRAYVAILLTQVPGEDLYVRTLSPDGHSFIAAEALPANSMQFTVSLCGEDPPPLLYHGFFLRTLGLYDRHIINKKVKSRQGIQDDYHLNLPPGQVGTAGIIILELPVRMDDITYRGFAYIKLGFDYNCSPICFVHFPGENVRNNQLIREELASLRALELDAHDWDSIPIVSDDWISEAPLSELPLNLYDSRLGSSDLDGSFRFKFSTQYFDLMISVTRTPDTWHTTHTMQDVWVVDIEAGTPPRYHQRTSTSHSNDCCCICS